MTDRIKALNTEMISVESLLKNPNNWRKHPEAQSEALEDSIGEHGFIDPLTWNKRSGNLVDGHERLEWANRHGVEALPCVVLDLSPSQERRLIASFDKITMMAETDEKVISRILKEMQAEDESLPAGWDEDEMAAMASMVENEDPFRDGPVPRGMDEFGDNVSDLDSIPTRTHVGECWALGSHRILIGDCTNPTLMDEFLGGGSVDLVFTDPPYNFETEGGSEVPFKGGYQESLQSVKDANIAHFDPDLFLTVMPGWFRSNHMSAYIFTNKDLLPEYLNFARTNKYAFDVLFWVKDQPVPMGGHHHPNVEYLVKLVKNGYWADTKEAPDAYRGKDLRYGRGAIEDLDHPTVKPIDLCENQLRLTTKANAKVLDPFAGSGTTLRACHNIGRICYSVEIEPRWADLLLSVSEVYTGLVAERIW